MPKMYNAPNTKNTQCNRRNDDDYSEEIVGGLSESTRRLKNMPLTTFCVTVARETLSGMSYNDTTELPQ